MLCKFKEIGREGDKYVSECTVCGTVVKTRSPANRVYRHCDKSPEGSVQEQAQRREAVIANPSLASSVLDPRRKELLDMIKDRWIDCEEMRSMDEVMRLLLTTPLPCSSCPDRINAYITKLLYKPKPQGSQNAR